VSEVLASYDLFFMPTLNENFGHALLESLAAGCPLLTSDETPWRGLAAAGAGWDIALDRESDFRAVIERVIAMGPDEHAQMRAAARAYAARAVDHPAAIEAYKGLFEAALRM